ncbi:AAA domain-containing protein [Pseudoalteromonas sp. ZZD1]|uniref:AAA domain-containing protein n=1 Tax=Pseudoalteromonas sp. ZZD1 TaxID=3139395 RepID=UPI003BAB08C4
MSLYTHMQNQYQANAIEPVVNHAAINTLVSALPMSYEQKQTVHFAMTQIASVIQGPPGTGKTQTLVNLVANLLNQQNSVLGLSAKAQGNHAVLEKLSQANIHDLALDLSEIASPRLLLDKLKSRYHSAYVAPHNFDFNEAQKSLNEQSTLLKLLDTHCPNTHLSIKALIKLYFKSNFEKRLSKIAVPNSFAQLKKIERFLPCFAQSKLAKQLNLFAEMTDVQPLILCLAKLPLLGCYKSQNLKQLHTLVDTDLPNKFDWQTSKTQLKKVAEYHKTTAQSITHKNLWQGQVTDAFWQLETALIQSWQQSKWYARWMHKKTAQAFKDSAGEIPVKKACSILVQQKRLQEKSDRLALQLDTELVKLSTEQISALSYIEKYFPKLTNAEYSLLVQSINQLKRFLKEFNGPLCESIQNKNLTDLISHASELSEKIEGFIIISNWLQTLPQEINKLFFESLECNKADELLNALKHKICVEQFLTQYNIKLPLKTLTELEQAHKKLVADIAYHTKYRVAAMMQTNPLPKHQQSQLRFYLSEKTPSLDSVNLLNTLSSQIQTLFPYIMVTPKTAKLLGDLGFSFNNLVADEASQLQLHEVLPALSMCKEVCLFGDEQQMPPSQWFSHDSELNANCESVLGFCYRYSVPTKMLTEHYRSKQSELIDFSNKHFYQNKLKCVEASLQKHQALFVHQHTEPYTPAPNCINEGEANKLIERLVSLSKHSQPKSIAIICSNIQQVKTVESVLRNAKLNDQQFAKWMSIASAIKPTIIGNLDSAQGLERDWVFISFTYGKQLCGKLSQQFGVFSQPAGERRLNVLLSRATERVEWFSNISDSDINISSQTPLGVNYIKRFIAKQTQPSYL